MNLDTAIPVRFPAETKRRVETISENTGIPVAKLIRIAVDHYLTEIARTRSITLSTEPIRDLQDINSGKATDAADVVKSAVASVKKYRR